MGILSPFFRTLPLEAHGLRWLKPPVSVAHPLDGEPAVLLRRSVAETAQRARRRCARVRVAVAPFLTNPHGLLADLLAPLRFRKHPLQMLRFGLHALRSATGLARGRFGESGRARSSPGARRTPSCRSSAR